MRTVEIRFVRERRRGRRGMNTLIGSTPHRNLSVRVQARVPLIDFLFVDVRVSFLRVFVASACWNRLRLRN